MSFPNRFDVFRSARDTVSFRGPQPAPLAAPVAQNLPNRQQVQELVAVGDGEVRIEGLYVFQPPERE